MCKALLVAIGCSLPALATAQDQASNVAVQKWRDCADAAAIRYAKSAESAPVVARLAALSCDAEKKKATEAVRQADGSSFAEEYVNTAEKFYIDRLSVKVIELRLAEQPKQ